MVKGYFSKLELKRLFRWVCQSGFLLALVLMGITQQNKAQIYEEDLIGTWFPVMEQFINDDTISLINPVLQVFEPSGQGRTEVLGNNSKLYPFNYVIHNNSLQIIADNDTFKTKVLSLTPELLIIEVDSLRAVSFVPLPEYHTGKVLPDLKKVLTNNSWQFEITSNLTNETYLISYHFTDYLNNLSYMLPDFEKSVFTAWSSVHVPHEDQSLIWSVGEHNNTSILRMQSVFKESEDLILIVKAFRSNTIEFVTWNMGVQNTIVARKVKRPTMKNQEKTLSLLTGKKWRIDKESFHVKRNSRSEEPIDFYTTSSVYARGPYSLDSTSLICRNDIEQQLVVLQFNPDFTYKVYREQRLLDEGRWILTFNGQEIRLSSSREEWSGDGVYGGIIRIGKLQKNRIILKRRFHHQLDHDHSIEESNWETYKPYRKQK
ncbi:MAG: hypothetical protein HEP71_17740 [Roseivirga sp.]|nr:hypothetical protein [Roseivirga sp.]